MNTCLLLWNPLLRSVFSLINVLGTWHPCPKLLVFIGWCMVFGLEKEQVGSGDTCSRYRAATFTPFVVTKRSGDLRDCTNYVSPKISSLEEMSLYAWPQFHDYFWKSFKYFQYNDLTKVGNTVSFTSKGSIFARLNLLQNLSHFKNLFSIRLRKASQTWRHFCRKSTKISQNSGKYLPIRSNTFSPFFEFTSRSVNVILAARLWKLFSANCWSELIGRQL